MTGFPPLERPPEVAGRTVSGMLTRVGVGALSVLGVLLLAYATVWVVIRVRVLIAPIVLATVLIYLLNPLVKRFRAVGIPRVVGAVLSFLVLVGVVVLLGFLIVPSISDQASDLASSFPEIYEKSATQIEGIADDLGFGAVELWSYEELEEFVNDPERHDQIVGAVLDRLGEVTSGIVEAILVFFIAPAVAFYILLDLPRLGRELTELLPPRHKDEVVYVARELGSAVGGFLRGQMLVAVIVGIMTSAGFALIGLDFALIIGLIAGFLNIIPFVGPWVGGALGVMIGLVTGSVTTAGSAALVALGVQQVDNHFISPTVLRATVRLHPAVVILVLVLGGALGGLWGVVLAVPVTASVKIVAGHLWRTRVLGQSWEEATSALIEPANAETLLSRIRREAADMDLNGEDEAGDAAPDDGLETGGDPDGPT
jgi:predicted PurR-regulated permease PerM